MSADIAQEVDVIQLRQPLRIVRHDRVGLAVAESQELVEDFADAGFVGFDRLDRKQLPALVLARGVADARRAAAHERDGFAAALLQPTQHHDLHERADMQRRRRAIEADIGDELAALRLSIQAVEVGALM